MRRRLIIDGNAVYEIDEACMRRKQEHTERDTEYETSRRRKNRQEENKGNGGLCRKEQQRRTSEDV